MYFISFVYFVCLFFFFKQKTAYEMRISDWSSDVCSSDLYPSRTRISQPMDRFSSSMMRNRKLPPLGALRAFEAAARHRSFRKAADELAVTPTEIGRASCRERVCQYV